MLDWEQNKKNVKKQQYFFQYFQLPGPYPAFPLLVVGPLKKTFFCGTLLYGPHSLAPSPVSNQFINLQILYPTPQYRIRKKCKLMSNKHTPCFIYYNRKSILQITQPIQYRCTQLQYRFAVISEAPRERLREKNIYI